MERLPDPVEPPRIALPMTGLLTVVVLALTETFSLLPAALAAYAAAWLVLRLGRDTPAGSGE